MIKLLKGIRQFQENLTAEVLAHFFQIASGQKPDTLFIGCSDSRVDPRHFASTDPGDVFVHRNVGNLIPPFQETSKHGDLGTPAAIEFPVLKLTTNHIIVCGHSECGAIISILKEAKDGSSHLSQWLDYGREILNKTEKEVKLDPQLSPHNRLSQLNVLLQLQHLRTYPFVLKELDIGTLQLHGWWFDIKTASIYCFLPDEKQFKLLDKDLIEKLIRKFEQTS